jgi:hypothetical protein
VKVFGDCRFKRSSATNKGAIATMRLTLPGSVDRDFFTPIVRWITSARAFLGHSVIHRMASANFNVRGWQGRQASYSADGLVFCGGAILGWTVAYLKRSILRRGFDLCSNSQSIQTKAMPKLTTTPRNSHVSPGVVSVRASMNECKFSERKPCSI